MIRIGIDTGGTFTDFVQIDAAGQLQIYKQLSTPADPSRAILAGIAALDYPKSAPVVHGSTVATNALLERRGARTALITTAGFEDVLRLAGRIDRISTLSSPKNHRPWCRTAGALAWWSG